MGSWAWRCECGDRDCDGCVFEPEEERDPAETTLEETPEGMGMVYWTWTADAIQSYISDIVSDLKFPMTENLLAQKLGELREWFEELERLEAA